MFLQRVLIFTFPLSFLTFLALASEECYMYTPYQYQRDGGDYRIGPYPSRRSCQEVNSDAFGGSGRCDCSEISDPSESYSYAPAGGVSGYSRQNAQQEAAIAQQQEYEANQQRMRQQQEQERQLQIEEKAKRDAEARRRDLEWKQKKADLMSSIKGSASGDFKLKGGGQEIELKPKGELQTKDGPKYIFGLPLKENEDAMVIKTRLLGASKTVSPSSDSENHRRALWLYKRAAAAKDPEEAVFLSQQADEAAQGHPLQVEVPPAVETLEISKVDLQKFEKMAEVVEKDHVKLDMVQQKRVYAEEKKTQLEKKLSDLKEKIQKPQEEPPANPEEPQAKEVPEPEKTPEANEESKPEKPKGGEDLLAELEALEKEIRETNLQAEALKKEESKARQTLEKSQQKLDTLLGKNNKF